MPVPGRDRDRDERALAPVAGALLLLLCALLAAGVAASALSASPGDPAPRAAFDLEVDPATDAVTVVHAGGDPVQPNRLRLRVTVDGEALARQPPVPFFAARGFRSGPRGPFNAGWNGSWRVGQVARFRLAATNAPGIEAGDDVRVRLYAGERLLADLRTRAPG
jgi:FlaG/FlaF family flagellin (archaellin)